ncbi:MAG: PhoH family protein [Phycisphaerales bacterium]
MKNSKAPVVPQATPPSTGNPAVGPIGGAALGPASIPDTPASSRGSGPMAGFFANVDEPGARKTSSSTGPAGAAAVGVAGSTGPAASLATAGARSSAADRAQGVKHFVVDTNVLLHDPNALFVFEEHEVVIPFTVIEELDRFKRDDGDRGRNAREAIRQLDRLRTAGRLVDGVRWGELNTRAKVSGSRSRPQSRKDLSPRSGSVRIDVDMHERPPMLGEDKADNRIIAVALDMARRGVNVVFVSKDLSARIKADALGLKTEDFENSKVNAEALYTGAMSADVPGEFIDELYRDRMLPLARLSEFLVHTGADGQTVERQLLANQFLMLRDSDDEGHTGLARRLADTDHVIPVSGPRKPTFGIMARNVQQTMALDLLMDEEVRMVTLLGSAGTGKTLVAVAAGMAKVFSEERYDKLLVARPIMPMGRDIGYLPGSKDDKLQAWMQPIFDNVAYLLSTRGAPNQNADSLTTEQRIEKLIAGGQLVLEPLTYIRGRSIPHQFMIVDEAQNLTPHEVKTIVSRIGEGTKLVLTGDVGQIDNPYLDSASNGLAYAIEKMKGLGVVGHVTLSKSERSELASLAATLL